MLYYEWDVLLSTERIIGLMLLIKNADLVDQLISEKHFDPSPISIGSTSLALKYA